MSFSKGKTITIRFDAADVRPDRHSARIEIDGRPFEEIGQATPEACRMEATIRTTAQSKGFYFVRGFPDRINRFLTTAGQTADPRKLVDAFRDQGFTVRAEGAYRAGAVLTSAEIAKETPEAFAASQVAEVRHVAARKRERTEREAGAVQRLQTAARAEDMRLELLFDYADAQGRNQFRLMKGGKHFDELIAAEDDEDAQAFVKDVKTIAKRNGVFVYDEGAGNRRNGVDEGLFISTMISDRNAAGRLVAALSRYARDLGGSLKTAGAYEPETASRHESGESVRLLRTYPELRLV